MLNTGIFPDLLFFLKIIEIFWGVIYLYLYCLQYRKFVKNIFFMQMSEYLENNDLIFQNQYGFRNQHSTKFASIHLTSSGLRGGGGADWTKARDLHHLGAPFPKYIRFTPSSSLEIGPLSKFQPGAPSNLNPPLRDLTDYLNYKIDQMTPLSIFLDLSNQKFVFTRTNKFILYISAVF